MNKRIKAIIEFMKVHKKETIGVAVALGIAVVGVGGYAISKHYATDTNNIALAEKKEDPKADEDKKLEENKATGNEEVTVEEQEDGSLIVKDKDGNIIADSSKGDDVSKIVEEKKEAGSDVNIKNKKGEVEKVESVDNGSIKVTSGETIGSKTENKVQASQQPSGEKVEKVEDIKGTTASSEGSITIVKPSKEESSSKPESKPQEQPEESKPEEAPQPSQKPEEKPQEQKPVEKPQRTWEYQSGMTQEIWNDFNAYRQSQGLNALNWSGKYAGWTKSHCEEMAQKQSGFHKSYPEGGQIVYDGTAYTSASSILNGFKNSPAHNKNMLDPDLTEGACAVYKDSNGRYYTVIGFDY